MKTLHIKLATICVGLMFITGCASVPKSRQTSIHVYRVRTTLTSGSHDLQIFIATGSSARPMVTIADNDGYPPIKDFYARPATLRGEDGINVTLRFEAPAQGRKLDLNVLQEGMTRNFEVMPFKRDR
ncbi:MAG: hypothetical protein ABJC04_12895 [Verrucomicrobiota bacterium]